MAAHPFVLFAHPRSGSTILAQVLDLHPDVCVLIEPFHPNFHTWSGGNKNYLAEIRDTASLDEQVGEIFQRYDGIKVTGHPLDLTLNEHMLARGAHRIVFLTRKNLLRASVSAAIAERTGVWQKSDHPEDPSDLHRKIGDLPLSEISDWIEWVKGNWGYLADRVKDLPSHALTKLTYEEIYDVSRPQQEAIVKSLFAFLGVTPKFTEAMRKLLNRGTSQINTEAEYRLIPNHEEIERKFGSEALGHLFH